MSRLTEDEVRAFHDQGFLLVRGALAPADLAPVIAEFDDFIDGVARRLHEEGRIAEAFADLGFERRLARICEHSDVVFRMLFNRSYLRPALFELLRSEKILDLAESIVGPEVMCHSGYRIRPKIPEGAPLVDRVRAAGVMPWHQDAAYLSAECDAGLYVTLWTPLTEATPENGCLEVIPGAHRGGVLCHRNVRGAPFLEIPPEALPSTAPVAISARPGDVLLIGNLTPHRSGPNRTERVRWSMDLRYHDPDLPQGYAGEVGFLARSHLRPGAVVTTCAEFERLRASNAPEEGPRWRRWPVEEPHPGRTAV
jgi:ectoine hydroxylase-related dioxygenase (phytanoyl-CoA dioxygenase family)